VLKLGLHWQLQFEKQRGI
jgi:hypothetical protein